MWQLQYPTRVQQKEVATQQKRVQRDQEAMKLLRDLEEKVNLAEASTQNATSTAQSLLSLGDAALSDATLKSIHAAEEVASSAMASCNACTEFIQSKETDLDEADGARPEVEQALARLSPRIQDALRRSTEAFNRAKAIGEKLTKKAAALRFEETRNELFAKYDADGDGFLNREEIRAYALGEFKFELPGETLDRIWRTLRPSPTSPGLPNAQFARLRTAIELAQEQRVAASKDNAAQAKSKPPPQPLVLAGAPLAGTTMVSAPLLQAVSQLPPGLTLSPEQVAQAIALAGSGAVTPATGPAISLADLAALGISLSAPNAVPPGSLPGMPRGF